YLVMQFIEGDTLASRLLKGPLPADELLRYAIQIADALDQAHRHGIVHRDLKPGNIMLTRSGAKVPDFGLAKNSEHPISSAETGCTGKCNARDKLGESDSEKINGRCRLDWRDT
ncbi:MAG TPA: protein kinase, partial [Acidobacteriota bacterium]|nr:protein kinase [Acidobacteriota bacterium]